MNFEEFQDRARDAFEEIPAEFRERVEGPVIVRDAHRHKDIRGMFTLGECVHAPDFAGGGELVSTVILYYGSFEELARRDPSFDVEAEIVETVRHEVQHHVEDAVGHAGLRDLDWAEEQNALWAEGREFAPNFWRAGSIWGDPADGLRSVGQDLFIEIELPASEWAEAQRDGVVLTVRGEELEIAADQIESDEEMFEYEGLGRDGHDLRDGGLLSHDHGSLTGDDGAGSLVVILRRRKSPLDLFRRRDD